MPRPPDLVDRDFTARRPDHLWAADMTYVRTWSGWVCAAFVLDVFWRTIVGWQVANHMRTGLSPDALEMALWRRKIKKGSGLIHHDDRLSLGDTSHSAHPPARRRRCRRLVRLRRGQLRQAMVKALNGTLQSGADRDAGRPLEGLRPGRAGILRWATWYNDERLHLRPRSRTNRGVRTRQVAATGSPRSPPETRSPDSTKLGAAHCHTRA
uniref:DDE-type integrase/transposase/recombinase n=1 Tax=Streptomyces sp. TG1A-60 TaxID=3129111 RepID=UPI00404021D6